MRKIHEAIKIDSTWNKAKKDEPLFILRASDVLAPMAIKLWAHAAEFSGAPQEKVLEAVELANRMEEWQRSYGSKVPD